MQHPDSRSSVPLFQIYRYVAVGTVASCPVYAAHNYETTSRWHFSCMPGSLTIIAQVCFWSSKNFPPNIRGPLVCKSLTLNNGRQHLEQRCSVLTQDLHKSVERRDDLEGQVSESRAELVRVSGALHARRGTDVVDAEMAFGEELQRVQESAMREARSLRQETGELRASLAQTKDRLRKACGER